MLSNYFFALAIAFLTESGVAAILGYKKKEFFVSVILVNLVTHPALNYLVLVITILSEYPSIWLILILELIVIVVEGELLTHVFGNRKKMYYYSFLANSASYVIGIILI